MIAERIVQYAQRVHDPVLGYRTRYALQVQVIDRMGFTRMQTVGYALDATHVERLKACLI